MGFNIFVSDDVELPHRPVADYLEKIDPKLCVRYLEHVLVENKDETTEFHDRLSELYLRQTLAAKKRGDDSKIHVCVHVTVTNLCSLSSCPAGYVLEVPTVY